MREKSNKNVTILLIAIACGVLIMSTFVSAAFGIIMNESGIHKSTYPNPIGESKVNLSKVYRVAPSPPKIPPGAALQFDTIRKIGTVKMDPRTCLNSIAFCYQIIDNSQNNSIYEKDKLSVSKNTMPKTRTRMFVCVEGDKTCVESATYCYCPTEIIAPFDIRNNNGHCSDRNHLCTNSFSTLKLCQGNLSSCQEKYLKCGCGMQDCIAQKNVCVDTRGSLILCSGDIAGCLRKYPTCFCGTDTIGFNRGCTTNIHTCTYENKNITCSGSLDACAQKYEICTC
jgi:hypothetical protein